MHNPGFARDHPRNVCVTGDPQQLIASRLTRAMIAQSQFSDAYNRIQIYDVVANAACQSDRRYVIAARVTPGAEAFFSQCPGLRKESTRITGRIVGSQYAYDAGYARARKGTQGYRWHAALETRFAATARNMGMPVDKPGYQPPATDIRDNRMRGGDCLYILADRKNVPSADGQMAYA